MSPRWSTAGRAYAEGLRATLMGQSPHRAWQVNQQLAQVAPEVAAAYALGRSASPAEPMPSEPQLLAQLVARLAAD